MYIVGDRVVVHGETDGKYFDNAHGTVVDASVNFHTGIQFDDDIHGHNCSGHGESGYCWYCARSTISFEEDDESYSFEESCELIDFLQNFHKSIT